MRMPSTHSPAYNSSVYTFLSILYENVDEKILPSKQFVFLSQEHFIYVG